jgi:dihydrofolate synthase/folylpolyglutamate synthase
VPKEKHIHTIQQAEAALLPYVPLVAQLTGRDTTLERIKPLMVALDNPQNDLRVIHIAGTSGKTSTAYYIAALLKAIGTRVGLTVSPHVDSITERVQINGQSLEDSVFCSELEKFREIVATMEQAPSYFELMYAFAIWEFARAKVDYAVVETGMGGLHDATNVITNPDKVCVITDIGFDHMRILGNTLPEIAAQKIGIVHDHNQVIMYTQNDEIMQVIYDWTGKHDAPLLLTTESDERKAYGQDLSGMPVYQQRNWLLAYRVYQFVAERDHLSELSVNNLKDTQAVQVPGRMDIWQVSGKTIVMDGAHNAQKMTAFVNSFKERYPGIKPAILLAFKQGKEYQKIVSLLASFASSIIVTTFASSQDLPAISIDPNEVTKALIAAGNQKVRAITDGAEALNELLRSPEEILVITGSFYLLSQLRKDIIRV